jgi:hypothetical protein
VTNSAAGRVSGSGESRRVRQCVQAPLGLLPLTGHPHTCMRLALPGAREGMSEQRSHRIEPFGNTLRRQGASGCVATVHAAMRTVGEGGEKWIETPLS